MNQPRNARACPFLMLLGLLAGVTPVAAQPLAAQHSGDQWLRVLVRSPTAILTEEGRLVVEAVDGGLLLERADTRYVTIQPDAIVTRKNITSPPAPDAPRELGQRILAELPAGFELHLTRHFIVCHATSTDYARWAGGLFERLHDAFGNYWTRAGLELTAVEQPLIVLIFANRQDYEAYATRDLGAVPDLVVGYYNLLSNRVATYDLTGSDALPHRDGRSGPAVREILAQPEAAGLVSTLVHEATHQLAFNRGMHRRLAPVPLWASEGIATVFETPDLRTTGGWRGIGMVNRSRLERFRRGYQPGDLEQIVAADDRFRNVDTALDTYAAAWALSWFLMETKRPQFVAYLKTLAAKQPLAADSPAQRRADFTAAFGMPPADLEPLLLRHISRLELRRP